MANQHGDFIWYELLVPDADAAEGFYAGLLGWSFEPAAEGGKDYRVASMAGVPVAGLMTLTPEMQAGGARPCWLGYLAVEDADAASGAIAQAGGKVVMEPADIPGVGRFAMALDPGGTPFYVMRGSSGETSESFAQDAPRAGHCAWNELHSTDPAAALAFYAGVFGWEEADRMEMGPAGTYQMLRNPPHATMLGAVMPAGEAPPGWVFYFRVPDIDVAAALIAETGGQVVLAPMEIPGGEYVLNALDPQGALFALIGKRGC
ncbi:VOC family protein [Poseidonocella sp. HB161398]|uniref:VOC family protein n=1 Tax=Poseidonocella sp. HB161398 TaxID=2320855 RepID=UPI00110921E4|nr:VOC family protein [Poseidonocella sp. HB161398]